MKNRIENIKRNIGSGSLKAGMVVLGYISGKALAYGLDKLVEQYPQLETTAKIAKPIVLGGGGLLISLGTTDQEVKVKHFGYGLATAGVIEGLQLLPITQDILSGLGYNGSTFYTESDKPPLDLGSFGLNALPVSSFNMEEAPSVKLDLPNLNDDISGLGYNPAITEDEEIKGLGYNAAQTGDDVNGII